MDEGQRTSGHHEPPAPRQQPGAQTCTAAADPAASPHRTGPTVSPVVASTAASKSSPCPRRSMSGVKAAGRVPPGELDHGRSGERIGGLRGDLRAPQGAVEAHEVRDRAPSHGQVQVKQHPAGPTPPRPSRRSPRRTRAGRGTRTAWCSARWASSWRRVRGRSARRRGATMVRAPGNAIAAPHSGARPPVSESSPRAVGHDDEPKRIGRPACRAQATRRAGRPPSRARRRAGSWAGQATAVTATDLAPRGDCCPANSEEGEDDQESRTARDLTSGRGQVEHFLAALRPGIELVGLVPLGPGLPASSRSPANQRARPSSK